MTKLLNSLAFAAVLGLAGVLLPGASQAQKVSHATVAADLRLCLDAAGLPDDVPGCIGRAARACEEKAPGDTPVALSVRCFEAEAEAWDDLLDDALAARLDRLRDLDATAAVADGGTARVQRLQAAQADWRDFRLTECAQLAAEFLGDSMADYVQAACLMNMTADRAVDLMMQEEY